MITQPHQSGTRSSSCSVSTACCVAAMCYVTTSVRKLSPVAFESEPVHRVTAASCWLMAPLMCRFAGWRCGRCSVASPLFTPLPSVTGSVMSGEPASMHGPTRDESGEIVHSTNHAHWATSFTDVTPAICTAKDSCLLYWDRRTWAWVRARPCRLAPLQTRAWASPTQEHS